MPTRLNGFKVRFLFKLCLLFFCASVSAQQVRMLVQSSPLAGYQYHAGANVWDQLQVGDTLTLIREPANLHDGNAIRVEWRGQQLGYLPRAENQAIAAELDRGTSVEARIGRLKEAKNPWQRVLIDVFIKI
jgi:hypothetical protein